MDVRIFPSALSGSFSAPLSKSCMHRALLCAAGADVPVELSFSGTLPDDALRTVSALPALGSTVTEVPSGILVSPADGLRALPSMVDCGGSASALRFLMCRFAAEGIPMSFGMDSSLSVRPLKSLSDMLREHGIEVGEEPVSVSGKLKGNEYTVDGSVTSQYLSGILMALPFTGEKCTVRLSTPLSSAGYVKMTLDIMNDFGLKAVRSGDTFTVFPGRGKLPEKYQVEGDWSGAAFILAAAAISGSVTASDLDPLSSQPDREILDILSASGAETRVTGETVSVRNSSLRPFDADADGCPDLVPVLAALAANIPGRSVIRNTGRLRYKESDRVDALVKGLGSLGAAVEVIGEDMHISGGELHFAKVDPFGDHRIAMALAVASLRCGCVIGGAECVDKSFPGFFGTLGETGVRYERI